MNQVDQSLTFAYVDLPPRIGSGLKLALKFCFDPPEKRLKGTGALPISRGVHDENRSE